jgi:hypothetical protein
MAIEDVSVGLAGVARYAQRPAKSALISNTDNSAVQQYAQVSLFTSFLADAAPAVSQNQTPPDRQQEQPQQAAPSYSSAPSAETSYTGSSEPPVSVLNYNAKATPTSVQNPNQSGKLISLSV